MIDNPRDRFQQMAGKSPEEAKFFWSGGPVEVAERTWFASLFSGVTAFDTDEGLVLIDCGMKRLAPALAGMIRRESSAAIHTVVYTHGHVDHAYGLDAFLLDGQPAPRVIAHRNVPERFARYQRTARHNEALNARQFGGDVSEAETEAYQTFALAPTAPDTLYDQQLVLQVGGVSFELNHCKGETDDHTWVYCPERGVLCPGDLFIWGVPNAGNPQKAQRYPWAWAEGLRAMAARSPASLCPGHGGPVVNDATLIERMLIETAELLEVIVERTLALMEAGSPPHVDIVSEIELPTSDSPWLQPIYDEAEFIVRNVVRYFGGWYDGQPSHLKPASRDALARELAALCGGVESLLTRAQRLADSGDLRLACHLADFALEAEPSRETIGQAVAAIYRQRAAAESSLMAINLFRAAAAYAERGRPYR